jgi:hypothetical protein
MIDEVTFNLVKYILFKNMTVEPRLFEKENDEGIEKTKMWLENVVIPCVQKLYLRDPDYVVSLLSMLDSIVGDVVE